MGIMSWHIDDLKVSHRTQKQLISFLRDILKVKKKDGERLMSILAGSWTKP